MSLFSVAEALVGITKVIREAASVIATPRRERIATAVTAAMLARGEDERMRQYANWREEFAREAIRFADDLIAELDRTAKPTPEVATVEAELADAYTESATAAERYLDAHDAEDPLSIQRTLLSLRETVRNHREIEARYRDALRSGGGAR